jgi:4-amino-4-deoxy-L-arabinose transferase-like glycosyltransferase
LFANIEESPATQANPQEQSNFFSSKRRLLSGYLLVALVAAAVYLGCIISPPSLMDDVDAVEAQIARNMLTSGDWVTERIDGVPFLEKGPLIYWCIAASFKVFGVHDWAARIPLALAAIALALLTAAFGTWAFGRRVGIYAGICIATCVGLFLFTRVQIPDVVLTLTIAFSMWSFLRVLDEHESHPRVWAILLAANLGVGLLLKSLIGVVFPVAAGVVYLALTKQLFTPGVWKRLRPFSGTLIILAIAAPWHILATLHNPPYFVFTMRSVPGEYHGFFWFYFINEQLLRFLNMRYPRDYDTVPRLYFWLFHLIWLFPWSVYFPAVAKLSFKPVDRAARTRLLALCWTGVVMVFFTFSTTQEYYSMPIYPALALLLGCAMATSNGWVRGGTRALAILTGACALGGLGILFAVRSLPTPGDISAALSAHPDAYKLALGHMEDLTLQSFAYLRLPLALATVAFLIGCIGTWRMHAKRALLATALMMVIFFQAARLALVVFDPYMSSRPLADVLLKSPPGELIINHHYFEFSSVFFYTNRTALLLNGRFHNLVYGSYAPGSAQVFINDSDFRNLWEKSGRCYLVTDLERLRHIEELVSENELTKVAESGGKFLLTNHPLASRAQ